MDHFGNLITNIPAAGVKSLPVRVSFGAEAPHPIRQQFREQPEGLARVPRLAHPVGDGVAGPERGGVVGPLDALPIRQQLAE